MRHTLHLPFLLLLLPLLLPLLGGCVSREERAAKLLLAEAQIAYSDSDYHRSLTLLDSLHRTFPGAVESRKVALRLQQLARSGEARLDSLRSSALAAEGVARLDSLGRLFKLIEYSGMPEENVLRYRGYDPSAGNAQADFLDAYIEADGRLRLVAGTSAPQAQEVTYLRLQEAAGGTFVLSDTIPYDRALNYRFRAGGVTHERLTLSLAASERLGRFVRETPADDPIRASFGPRGKSFTLSKAAREAIAATCLYYSTYVAIKEAEGRLDAAAARVAHFDAEAALSSGR